MAAKQKGKRLAPAAQGPSKKRKLSSKQPETKKLIPKSNGKGKERLADRGTIPIPEDEDENGIGLSDQDLEVFEEYGGAASFLSSLDKKAISRSKKETDRLHRLNKPARKVAKDDLPSVESDEDGDEPFGTSDDESVLLDDDMSSSGTDDASNVEMEYEKAPRKRRPSWEPEEHRSIKGLPIKLPSGDVRSTGKVSFPAVASADKESSESESDEPEWDEPPQRVDDVSTGARFGRPAVVDVVSNQSKAARIHGAKEQLAGICQEIVADPENSLGLLRRLHTFSLAEISTPSHPEPVSNDPIIRKLALLSQLAVFKDIIPGYRIRALSDKEKAEKVSQMVARTRDWEQGLVTVYQTYLRSLETELKARSDLADVALKSMCTLLKEVPHFNFRINLMSCIVARLSKKSWDTSSDMCLDTIIHVFREDLTGVASLEIVRLMNRMIKEKRFNVHPEVLSCLLHLRLKTELGIRASDTSVDKPQRSEPKISGSKAAARRAKGKSTELPHLSKKTKKALKEKKEIDKEVREAEAEVDKEERAVTQTETLKLLFVLYFRIIKNPQPTPLLPTALHGISKFAHLVNIDFFKDLMAVLKELISEDSDREEHNDGIDPTVTSANNIRYRLLCIVTAFELLSGQGTFLFHLHELAQLLTLSVSITGEALNIDLSDFISALYASILPLTLMTDVDATPPPLSTGSKPAKTHSVSDMLFRALNLAFSPRSLGATAPSGRSAAFAKRLLSASLHWPPATALRALEFVDGLIAKDVKLEALLTSKDRTFDGIYHPELDDPQLANPFGSSFWELHALREKHWDAGIRSEAERILGAVRS